MRVEELIEYEEGFRAKPYCCSEGYPTVGIGKRIGPKWADLDLYQFTVSREVAIAWLHDEILHIESKLQQYDWFDKLEGDRRSIIISMAYNLGISGLLKFKNMIEAIKIGCWGLASKESLDSRWAKQVPNRANRHAEVLRCSSIAEVYGG